MLLWLYMNLLLFLFCDVNGHAVRGLFADNTDENAYEYLPGLKLYKFENSVYYFGTILKGTYFKATQFCNYHDMKLLSIETEEENNFIKSTYRQLLPVQGELVFWTSGSKMHGDQWVWLSTGNSLIYTNWAPGQPENRGEKCVDARLNFKDSILSWHDNGCEVEEYFVCEAPVRPAENPKSNVNCVSYIDVRRE